MVIADRIRTAVAACPVPLANRVWGVTRNDNGDWTTTGPCDPLGAVLIHEQPTEYWTIYTSLRELLGVDNLWIESFMAGFDDADLETLQFYPNPEAYELGVQLRKEHGL